MNNKKERIWWTPSLLGIFAIACFLAINPTLAGWFAGKDITTQKVETPGPKPNDFVECWFFPWLPWCMPPDPPNLPKPPKPEPIPVPPDEVTARPRR